MVTFVFECLGTPIDYQHFNNEHGNISKFACITNLKFDFQLFKYSNLIFCFCELSPYNHSKGTTRVLNHLIYFETLLLCQIAQV